MNHTYWPHAPLHLFNTEGTYIVTAGTYQKLHLFNNEQKLRLLHDSLLFFAHEYKWNLKAWAIFSNHYHFIADSPKNPESLQTFLAILHQRTSSALNQLDLTPNRKVWHRFWDTKLTFIKSYFARLNYVHNNPVKHGLVKDAILYPWCSAYFFEKTASHTFRKTIKSFDTTKVNVLDDF